MRKRTPSEIKAYGDGYAEAYKEFCHLLKNHDVDKAMRKMEIFVKAVEITVETAMDEPQTCSVNGRPYSECVDCEHFKCTADEPQTERKCVNCKFLTYMFGKTWCNIKCDNPHDKVCDRWQANEPQTDCPWK